MVIVSLVNLDPERLIVHTSIMTSSILAQLDTIYNRKLSGGPGCHFHLPINVAFVLPRSDLSDSLLDLFTSTHRKPNMSSEKIPRYCKSYRLKFEATVAET